MPQLYVKELAFTVLIFGRMISRSFVLLERKKKKHFGFGEISVTMIPWSNYPGKTSFSFCTSTNVS